MTRTSIHPLSRRTFILAATGAGLVASAGVANASPNTQSRLQLPGRQVWAHYLGHGLPNIELSGGSSPYGSDHPLQLLAPNTPDDAAGFTARINIPLAQEAGITGMQLLQFDFSDAEDPKVRTTEPGTNWVDQWIPVANETWESGATGFSIAPCILPGTVEKTTGMIREYLEFSKGQPSAATVEGRTVIYIYSAGKFTRKQWQQIADDVADIAPIFLVGDVSTAASQTDPDRPYVTPEARDRMQNFDALWMFDDHDLEIWDEYAQLAAEAGKPFVGGMMPGYNRETETRKGDEVWLGGNVDCVGTLRFRQLWQKHLDTRPDWANLVTWNDFVEHTTVQQSSDWGVTRSDINAFYSAKFRGVALPRTTADLYVTTPKFVQVGQEQSIDAEALVLNGSNTDVQVSIRMMDASGKILGKAISSDVPAGQAGEARSSAAPEPVLQAGRTLYALATVTGPGVNERVRSAPIVVYAKGETPIEPAEAMRRTYYSRSTRNEGSHIVTLQVSTPPDGAVISEIKTGADVHMLELLQNTRVAHRSWNEKTARITGPMEPIQIVGGQVTKSKRPGFYVARATDKDGNVRYSRPTYVS